MLLVLDVGNTNIVIGVYDADKLSASFRISTAKVGTADEMGLMFVQLLQSQGISPANISGAIISSVVPDVMYSMERAVKKYIKTDALVVGRGLRTGINIRYDNPKEVGADRIVNAVAAHHIYKCPLIIVDFGTATTFCAISAKGDYLGGCICPGVKISTDALFQRTSKLPRIEIVKPQRVVGKNTVESMQSGVFYGYVGQVDYIISKMKKELGQKNIKVIATGGLARLIAQESQWIKEIHSTLTLEGLRIIYNINKQKCCVPETKDFAK